MLLTFIYLILFSIYFDLDNRILANKYHNQYALDSNNTNFSNLNAKNFVNLILWVIIIILNTLEMYGKINR